MAHQGVVFVLFQYINDDKPELGVTIIVANSSGLKDTQLAYSPVDCELLVMKCAASATHYYLYGCPIIHIFTNCSSLDGMFVKEMSEIENKRQQRMIQSMANYNFKLTHIKGVSNSIADCLSRLTRCIWEAPHYFLADSILVPRAKTVKGHRKQINQDDS